MFDCEYTRYLFLLIWLIVFLVMWVTFNFLIQRGALIKELNDIENNVILEEWDQANCHMHKLKEIWQKNKLAIQSNNETEALSSLRVLIVYIFTYKSIRRVKSK